MSDGVARDALRVLGLLAGGCHDPRSDSMRAHDLGAAAKRWIGYARVSQREIAA